MLSSNEIAKVLQYYPVLGELPPAVEHAFVNLTSPYHASPESDLLDFCSPIPSFLMLTSGSIRVVRSGKTGEITLYRLQPGEYCILSLCNILAETPYQTRAVSESEIEGVAIPSTLFKQMAEESPIFSTCIFHAFASRLGVLLDLIDSVTFMRLDERLAYLLIAHGGVVHATHSQLADELGSVREVISRILKDFETRGVVRLGRGQVQILDLHALKKIARLV